MSLVFSIWHNEYFRSFYVLDYMVSLVCYVTAFARFGVREQFKQQGAKSVNVPSFVCSLYSLD
jgi:hypothetical protein